MTRWGIAILLAVLAAIGGADTVRAGEPDAASSTPGPAVRTVVIGPRYLKGALQRWLWGSDYRDLYATPVALPLLDLRSYDGGLRPTAALGQGPTRSLALRGADGVPYTFRPVLKDPTAHLPAELRDTLPRRWLIEQRASAHPAAHLVVPGLLRAAGILHNEPRLVVMPDDPALGELRVEFKDAVGDIEEWTGRPAFGGTTETIDGEEMWKRLQSSPDDRVDSRAYLKARLVDHLVGDWDRDRQQWRWGRVPGKPHWQPIPEDRDEAFARFEGVFAWLLRPHLPLLVKFGPEHSDVAGLTYDSWDVDKRVLADLDWRAWDEVARELQEQLTDDVIEAAVRRQPPEFLEKDGERMIAGLKGRRQGLAAHAKRYYDYVSENVDVFCTDAHELVEAHRLDDGGLELRVSRASAAGAPAGEPYFRRRFEPGTTDEVRVYLHGGDDTVLVTGGPRGGTVLRVVGGDGADVLDDSAGGGTRFSGSGSSHRVAAGPGTRWDRRTYAPPPPGKGGEWMPARDFGRSTGPRLQLSYGSDYGGLIGASLDTVGYGFRKDPWADRQGLKVVYSTGESSARGTYLGQFRFENSPFRIGVAALGSGIETGHFFGSGNTTTYEGDADVYQIEQDRLELEAALVYGPTDRLDLSLGPVVRYDSTEAGDNPVLGAEPVYGEGHFTQVGLSARGRFDTTGRLGLPRKGVLLTGTARYYPGLADVTESYGGIFGDVRGYLSTPGVKGLTLALRAGGQKVFGPHPFFDSAFIGGQTPFGLFEPGGGSSVRGLPPQRYAGDSSLYGGTELYLPLVRTSLLMRGHVGVMGFLDVGRVWLTGESSNRWHHGSGGGLFFTTPGRHSLVSLQVGTSEGDTSLYLRTALVF
ncbi:MAG TPA: hypothetical protein VGB87_23725 [Vicinamibacteria bacterium]